MFTTPVWRSNFFFPTDSVGNMIKKVVFWGPPFFCYATSISVQFLNIQSRRALEYFQIKDVEHCQNVVKHLSLQMLIPQPGSVCREEVKFNRNTLRCWLQLAHQHSHLLVYLRVVLYVLLQIMSENIKVNLLFACCLKSLHPRLFSETLHLLGSAEAHGMHINVN